MIHKVIASFLGIGFIKGGGSIAAALFCAIWYFTPAYPQNLWQYVISFLIIIIGTWSSNRVDEFWGKDSNKVVIDEVAGMAIALLSLPHHWVWMVLAFVAFRFFDIVKPFGIKIVEQLPKGYGVMADDLLSGFYAWILVWITLNFVK